MPRSMAPTSKAQRVRVEVFLEEEHDVLALEVAVRGARALQILEVLGELEHVLDLLGGEVEQTQEAATGKVNAHV